MTSDLSGNQLWSKSSEDSYKHALKQGCRCIEIDLWDGDSPSSSEAEDDKSQASDANGLSGFLKKKLNRLRSRSDPKQPTPDSPAADDLMPTPWRTTSDRSEPVVYHGYTATKEISFRKVCLLTVPLGTRSQKDRYVKWCAYMPSRRRHFLSLSA